MSTSFSPRGLAIFAPTADQRYLMGAEVFLRTHFPTSMRRFQNGRTYVLSEDQLLTDILSDTSHAPGNRLWVLYGAPGSGKSELIKLIETRLRHEDPTRAAALIRVSRNELDVLSIFERFQSALGGSAVNTLARTRWNAARQKPRTLTKLILLFALETTVDSDEAINALFYRLVNVIQPHVEHTLIAGTTTDLPQRAELLSLETWEEILRETAIAVPIEYEVFRHQLTESFTQHMFGGLSLTETLDYVSRDINQRHGCRPILLVDDLVQSLSLYATDLLDYFLTLEAGNWDVVMGLTPAAFEDTKRGRMLLQRISHLDTIDDRVEKLWLSDETGLDSYVLTEENCCQFAAPYLAEFCRLSDIADVPSLYPFNREALIRIFRGLPHGKGKVRYFLRHIRDILAKMIGEESALAALAQYARVESMAHSENQELNLLCELFGPIVVDASVRAVTLSGSLLESFGLPNQDMSIPIEPLLTPSVDLGQKLQNEIQEDEEKRTVRDWLLGRPVNRQSLKSVRRGTARWLRMTQAPELIHRPHVARPRGVLRWHHTYLGTRPPICLEGVDNGELGIIVLRSLGTTAFSLHRYATATGRQNKLLELEIASELSTISLMMSAADYQSRVIDQLVKQVGMSLEEFALCVFAWLLVAYGIPELRPPGFSDAFWMEVSDLHETWGGLPSELDGALHGDAKHLFEDCFKLRENIYDGPAIARSLSGRTPLHLLERLLVIQPLQVDPDYRLGNRSLASFLDTIQQQVHQWTSSASRQPTSQSAQSVIAALLRDSQAGVAMCQVGADVWSVIRSTRPDIYAALRVHLADVQQLLPGP